MGKFGESLKRERELREISLREIADATKINLRYLEALEQNRFEVLPGGVFNKGFIRAYATFIGVDGEALVDSYLQETRAGGAPAGANGGSGVVAASGQGGTGLHRPVEAPRRRAGEQAPAPAAPPGITFADSAAPRRMEPATVPSPTAAAPDPISATDHGSRAPVIIASLMIATGVLFALFIMTRGPHGRPSNPLEVQAPVTEPAMPSAPPTDAPVDAAVGDAPTIQEGASQGPQVPRTAAPPAAAANPGGAPLATPSASVHEGPRVSQPPAARVAPPAPVPVNGMDLRIEATAPVLVQAFCDGEDRLNRTLAAGDMVTMHCLSLIRISATDAGAVRLTVNGARCAPLGEPGGRVEGFSIHIDDFRSICPGEDPSEHAGR